MEERTSTSKAKYELIADIGSGLIIAKVKLSDLREQDINARIMQKEMQKQLTDNIRKRGQLESLPLCALVDDKIEIISGHHRVVAAKESGILEFIYVILDVSGLNRSQIAAKQLAHNAISGFDDKSTLKEIAKLIQSVDDMIESYAGKDILEEPMGEIEKLISPKTEFEWKNIVFSFLPHQLEDLDKLVNVLEGLNVEVVGIAPEDQYKDFVELIARYQKFADVKNVGMAVHSMIEHTGSMMDEAGFDEDTEFKPISKLFGTCSIPKEAYDVVNEAIKKMVKQNEIDKNNPSKALELMATYYMDKD